jgi:hypothetical protein
MAARGGHLRSLERSNTRTRRVWEPETELGEHLETGGLASRKTIPIGESRVLCSHFGAPSAKPCKSPHRSALGISGAGLRKPVQKAQQGEAGYAGGAREKLFLLAAKPDFSFLPSVLGPVTPIQRRQRPSKKSSRATRQVSGRSG